MGQSDMLKPEEWDLWDKWMHAQRLLAQEIDRRLQSEFGISKPEFSVLVTLLRAPGREMRVVDVAESLGWEKSRVSHQLTRMESRGLVVSSESGASGRRTGIALTPQGLQVAESAVLGHARNVRHCFFDLLSPGQAAAIRAWSEHLIELVERGSADAAPDAARR
jgi:DNA-binding MarR family transcriptional regulator